MLCTLAGTVQPQKLDKPTEKSTEPPLIEKGRAVRILAKSIFRELQSQGYDEKQIVALATALISQVTDKIAAADAKPHA